MALSATIGLFSITATTVFAADKEAVKPADTVEGIMKQIHEKHGELATVVKNKQLADVHHHAFAIRDLVNALPDKSKDLEAEKLGKLKGNA